MNVLSKGQKIVSIILKIIVVISMIVGVSTSAASSAAQFMGGDTVFMYFTVQSNILVGIVCLIGAVLILANKSCPKVWYIIKFAATISITLTGMVYCFVLAPGMKGNAWTLPSTLMHAIVPLASVIDFFVICNVMKISKINVLWVTVPPLMYAVYSGIGYIRGWEFFEGHNYPYFFLNWGSEAGAIGVSSAPPFMGPVWWILILFVFLIIVGLIYLFIADLIRKKSHKS